MVESTKVWITRNGVSPIRASKGGVPTKRSMARSPSRITLYPIIASLSSPPSEMTKARQPKDSLPNLRSSVPHRGVVPSLASVTTAPICCSYWTYLTGTTRHNILHKSTPGTVPALMRTKKKSHPKSVKTALPTTRENQATVKACHACYRRSPNVVGITVYRLTLSCFL